MLTFSPDPQVAEKQMQAIIFYLTTFGYIDGDFDASERDFVRDYIRKLVERRVDQGVPGADAKLKGELVGKFTTHFHEVFENIDRHVKELFTESVASDEDPTKFVHAKLKLRCFEIFQGFDRGSQEALLETVDTLIEADGQVHPAEVKFRGELASLLEAELGVHVVIEEERPPVRVSMPVAMPAPRGSHPFLDQLEFHYSRDPETIAKQVAADLATIDRAESVLEELKAKGKGKLEGHKTVAEFAGQEPFLDDHVYVVPPVPGRSYEVIVLGDLHGCYSCLKAAVMQTRFFEKVEAFRKDTLNHPEPKLVLLGDYIDRGMFSLNGVLRTALQLLIAAPEHVYVLRGNHEFYLEYKGQIYGGVKPAEAINTLKPHLPIEVFRRYMRFFDVMPNSLLFDRVLFAHAGIPRDLLLKERWKDLSSLNDPDIRFQMMWSDPSTADVIPAQLQEQSARFPFGRLQFQSFMQRIGCHTMVRGHEKTDEGFEKVYDDPAGMLITLFSAGGKDNDDLPLESSYRSVTPMAMTMKVKDGEMELIPFVLDYEAYNDPSRNAFFRVPPEIEHRVE
jgi:hypothetical protein